MASETVHTVQGHIQGRGKTLKAEQQMGCKTAEEARRKAERSEMGDNDDNAAILFKAGQLSRRVMTRAKRGRVEAGAAALARADAR